MNCYRVHVKHQGMIFLAFQNDDLLAPFQNCLSFLKLAYKEDTIVMNYKFS